MPYSGLGNRGCGAYLSLQTQKVSVNVLNGISYPNWTVATVIMDIKNCGSSFLFVDISKVHRSIVQPAHKTC
ncbi:unnamed protein product [Camellia sinensis]